jgi:Uncharacterised nucleotidyltransferase
MGRDDRVAPGRSAWRAEDELALLLVGTAERRRLAAPRISALSAAVDEDRLLATLIRQRILLLAGARRLESAPDTVPPAFRARLEAARAAASVRAMVFSTVTAHLTATLEAAGIPAIALKGATLAEELYGDAAMRDYDDVDILVPAGELERAVARAAALGWSAPRSPGARSPLHRTLVHEGGAPPLELHWRLHWYEKRFADGLVDRSRLVDGRRRLEPADQFAALLLYYARDGFAGLRLAADLAAWWDRHDGPAAVAALERRAPEHDPLAAAWRTALAVAADVVGLATPAAPARSWREALARRLVNWDLRGDPDQIIANVTLVDGLLAPAGGLRAFVRRRLEIGGAAKTSVRYTFALWYLRGGRVWSPLPCA